MRIFKLNYDNIYCYVTAFDSNSAFNAEGVEDYFEGIAVEEIDNIEIAPTKLLKIHFEGLDEPIELTAKQWSYIYSDYSRIISQSEY